MARLGRPVLLLIALLWGSGGAAVWGQQARADGAADWPSIGRQSRPWIYWHWLGSAVDEGELNRHLKAYQEARLGGVHIIPIYGAEGYESRYIDYLSPRWMEMLRFTLDAAERNDLGVDMTTGTGWCFGGPWVADEDGNQRAVAKTWQLKAGDRVKEKMPAALDALVAYSPHGQSLDLLSRIDGGGRLDWSPADGTWDVYAVSHTPTRRMVKRAAPGGEGLMINPFSRRAMDRFLARFDEAFADWTGSMPRAFYNDSYEYVNDWSDNVLEEFSRRRGYRLEEHLPALFGKADADKSTRVRADYRQTVADLMLDAYTRPWDAWAARRGVITRNEAHGSPGNLLDLYAAADIPETEVFGTSWVELTGLDLLEGTPAHVGGEAEVLGCKLASSAAHVAGKPLVSSESCTWLGEHFKVPLAHVKAELDWLFVMGVNHVFYHALPYSPADAQWPGWLFYAETNFGPTMPFWRDLPALNQYVARCQSFLQTGRPDNPVLVYFPFHDIWATGKGLVRNLTVHSTKEWLDRDLPAFTAVCRRLWQRGYGFDFVSDSLLRDAVDVRDGKLQSRGGRYDVLLVAGCRLMPAETMERIAALARGGAKVVFLDGRPADVPGLGDLETRRRRFEAASASVQAAAGDDLEALLVAAGANRESMVDQGLQFIRRRDEAGPYYFVMNPTRQRLDAPVTFSAAAADNAILFDPMTGRRGMRSAESADGGVRVHLQLAPSESVIVRLVEGEPALPRWPVRRAAGEPVAIDGPWHVEFIEGGGELPASRNVEELSDWTGWDQDSGSLDRFAGTACYTTSFERPKGEPAVWRLDLGRVCYSAHVRLNGKDLGTLVAHPFQIDIPYEAIKEGGNTLEIEVTNLAANRVADLDRRKVPWRKYFFVDINYHEFDASGWKPLESGLVGPVELVPMGEEAQAEGREPSGSN